MKEQVLKKFQKNYNRLKKEHKLTYEKLSELTDISVDTLKSYKRENAKFPEYLTLVKLAGVFNVSPDYLCGYYDSNDEPMAYLIHLVKAIEKLGLDVDLSNENLTVTTNEENILRLFKEALHKGSFEFNKDADFINFHGKLMSRAKFLNLKRELYLYSHNMEFEDYENTYYNYEQALRRAYKYTDINEDVLYNKKLQIWDLSNGHPDVYVDDIYYDLIYKFDEFQLKKGSVE